MARASIIGLHDDARNHAVMRINEPVTQREYALPAGRTLVSITDLKGRIACCNASFVAVSGFTRDELLGQPHNILRHPDMPEDAFGDMWATIQAGRGARQSRTAARTATTTGSRPMRRR